jgi:hypothetical protein
MRQNMDRRDLARHDYLRNSAKSLPAGKWARHLRAIINVYYPTPPQPSNLTKTFLGAQLRA